MLSRTPTGRLDKSSLDLKIGSETARPSNSKSSSTRSSTTSLAGKTKESVSPVKQKPSYRLNPAVVKPLGNKKHVTSFSALYAKGEIPCRLNHGSVKHKITWSRSPENLDYNPVFITFCDGLRETQHPYVFLVRTGLREMLEAPGAAEKVCPIVSAIVAPLRAALGVREKDTFLAALDTLTRIANVAGPVLVPYLPSLVPPVAARVLSADMREAVYDTLRACEVAGGEQALKTIKNLCPTYRSIFV
ncbi:uncharacterized protein SPPG_06516 [Spizellomyces punctatus DAOM BR117]|uniref:PACRG-like protein n=1 Tax=Spizellomyces punctatus (strain DAOM BR117) TaxID=645134 RepID=A0A0L0HAC9_SPIPD|nr:uncharacterized protein SPPG_06516 [Spizellomyces punctatus DAOM BR117]KNC98107.1 hypothetical protein SPPG_06516 [Spizellomyces punctatus DAOM BR117]|eukprot:XP_016606147.1 hypothetical protein SPPG_06516 [Spizellomyces punctatus DAOM BR117]